MRKFIINSIIFISLIFTILVCLNLRFKHITHQNDYSSLQYEEILHQTTNADNVIIGTSHATHGIQPQILNKMGTSFFNFAFNGANPEFYLLWYNNIFKPFYKKPKYIIIEADFFFFDTAWLWRKYEQDSEYFPESVFLVNLLRDNKLNKSMLLINRFPVLKYRKQPKKLFYDSSGPFLISKYKDGFVPYQIANPKVEEFYPKNITIEKKQKNIFEDLIKRFTDDGLKIIMITTPTYNTNVHRYTNIPIYEYFDSLSAKYSIPYINYNVKRRTFINSNKLYYSDGGHLNYLGSIEFSKLLMDDLKKIMKL